MILSNLIQESIKRNFSTETRNVTEQAQRDMEEAGCVYQGFCIPFKEERATLSSEKVAGTSVWDLQSAIYNTSALKKGGAEFVFGLKHTVQVPTASKLQSYWVSESDNVSGDAHPSFSEVTVTPHRLSTYVTVSKMLINQTSNVDKMLCDMLAIAINEKLEKTIFSATQITDAPLALFKGETGNTISGYADICGMEDIVDDVSSPTYILSKKARAAIRKMSNGGSAVYADGKIDGTPCVTSSNVEDGFLVYGDLSKLKVCVWGNGIDMVIDSITDAKNGNVRLIVNFYVDYCVTNKNAIAVAQIESKNS